MKPCDLFKIPPVDRSFELYSYGFIFPEEGDIESDANKKVEILEHGFINFDGNRIWELASAWFEGVPFAVIQRAGRSGQDHQQYFITNANVFIQATAYLRSLIISNVENENIISETEDCPDLDRFYSFELSAVYDPNLKPKYKVGDIVVAWVKENHLTYDDIYVLTRVVIESVSPYNPLETYSGHQIDRCVDHHRKTFSIVFKKDEGYIGERTNDKMIVRLALDNEDAEKLLTIKKSGKEF